MTTSQLCREQLQRIFENKLANRPEHLERVAARSAERKQIKKPKTKEPKLPASPDWDVVNRLDDTDGSVSHVDNPARDQATLKRRVLS